MKTIEEMFILEKIDSLEKKRIEYLEVDNNKIAKQYENKIEIWNNIYNLIEDGYKYRELKIKEINK